jgi:hypothetical protein
VTMGENQRQNRKKNKSGSTRCGGEGSTAGRATVVDHCAMKASGKMTPCLRLNAAARENGLSGIQHLLDLPMVAAPVQEETLAPLSPHVSPGADHLDPGCGRAPGRMDERSGGARLSHGRKHWTVAGELECASAIRLLRGGCESASACRCFLRNRLFQQRDRTYVGKNLYVQTPYRWFPIEPHFLAFFVHWLPRSWHKRVIPLFSIRGWFRKGDDVEVGKLVEEVRLLSVAEMKQLFPDCEIHRERVFGFVKSLIAVRSKIHRDDATGATD